MKIFKKKLQTNKKKIKLITMKADTIFYTDRTFFTIADNFDEAANNFKTEFEFFKQLEEMDLLCSEETKNNYYQDKEKFKLFAIVSDDEQTFILEKDYESCINLYCKKYKRKVQEITEMMALQFIKGKR